MKKLFQSSNRTRRPRKPSMLAARIILLTAALAFAAFTVTEYGLSLWQADARIACFVMFVFGVSALVTPVIVPLIARARGAARLALILVAIAFGAIDSFGLSQAFNGFEIRATQSAFEAASKTLQARRAPLQSQLEKAEAQLADLVIPNHEYTTRQAAALEAYKAQAETLKATIAQTQTDLENLPHTAERPDMFDNQIILAISTLIQLALAFGFIAIEATRCREFDQAISAYEAKLATARQERADKRKHALAMSAKPSGRPNLIAVPRGG